MLKKGLSFTEFVILDFTYEAANLRQNHSDKGTPLFWVDQTPEIENVDQSELIH